MIITLDGHFGIDADSHQYILRRRRLDEDGNLSEPPVWGRSTYHSTLAGLIERLQDERVRQAIIEASPEEEHLEELVRWLKETHASDVRDIREQLGLNSEIRTIIQEQE